MTGSVYAVLLIAMATCLVVAMVLPAPSRASGDQHGLQLALIGGGATAAIAMGVLALLDLSGASTICAGVACLFVAPCAWLARAPQSADGWQDEEDDDGGGSPPPHRPSDPPAPDDGLPGLRPAAAFSAAGAAWAPAAPAPALATATYDPPARAPAPAPAPAIAVTPVTSTATRVQRMIALREDERARAALEVPRLVAAQQAERMQAEREAQRLLSAAALVQLAEDDRQATDSLPAATVRSRPRAARPRADHPSIAHVMAANAHGSLRHRAPATRRGVRADARPIRRD